VADISEAVATLAGVRAVSVEKGEVVAHADRDAGDIAASVVNLRESYRHGSIVALGFWLLAIGRFTRSFSLSANLSCCIEDPYRRSH